MPAYNATYDYSSSTYHDNNSPATATYVEERARRVDVQLPPIVKKIIDDKFQRVLDKLFSEEKVENNSMKPTQK